MKKEIELALQNIDVICEGIQMVNGRGLTRNEHAILARNIKLIHDTFLEAEQKKKPKEEKKNGKS